MKKYSPEYFEKKFKILFNKLLVKESFIDEVRKIRKVLGIPVLSGFPTSQISNSNPHSDFVFLPIGILL